MRNKTVYFPGDRTPDGQSCRITLDLSTNGHDPDFHAWLERLSSRDIRLALGNPTTGDLEARVGPRRQDIGHLISDVLDGLAAGDSAEVEGKVKARVAELCDRFPIYG